MALDPNLVTGLVAGGTTLLTLALKQGFAERRARRLTAHKRLERRHESRREAERLDSERVQLLLDGYKEQMDRAEAREDDCQDRCRELEARVDQMEIDNKLLDAQVIECQREIGRLRETIAKHEEAAGE